MKDLITAKERLMNPWGKPWKINAMKLTFSLTLLCLLTVFLVNN